MVENKMVYRTKRKKNKSGAKYSFLHNTRKILSVKEFIDEKRSKFNIYGGAKTEEEFWQIYNEKMKLITSNRKPQRNSSIAVEEVHSFSHKFCENWLINENEKNTVLRYFKELIEAIEKRRGKVILSYAIHMDESTPHIHILYIPLVYTKDNICKYSSSEFVGKKADLRAIQTYLHENVGKKYGLLRGTEGSRAKNVPLNKYREKLENDVNELENDNNKLQNIIKSNRNLNEQLEKDKKEIEEIKKDIIKKENDVTAKQERINGILETYDQIEKLVNNEIVIDIPKMPTPPFEAFEDKRRAFTDTWQDKFNKVIKKLVTQLKSVLFKNSELLDENNELKHKCEKFKKRAISAEKDLAEKPINDIITMRKTKVISEQKNTKINQAESLTI